MSKKEIENFFNTDESVTFVIENMFLNKEELSHFLKKNFTTYENFINFIKNHKDASFFMEKVTEELFLEKMKEI
jgi:hypothetical protein